MGADKIVVIQAGRVMEEGTHPDLMRREGIYKKLVDLQRQSADWTLAGNQQ